MKIEASWDPVRPFGFTLLENTIETQCKRPQLLYVLFVINPPLILFFLVLFCYASGIQSTLHDCFFQVLGQRNVQGEEPKNEKSRLRRGMVQAVVPELLFVDSVYQKRLIWVSKIQ